MNRTNLPSNAGAHFPTLGASTTARSSRSGAHAFGPGAAAWLAEALRTLGVWRERVRTRGELMRLEDRLLADIGLTREAVAAEWRKPFWRA